MCSSPVSGAGRGDGAGTGQHQSCLQLGQLATSVPQFLTCRGAGQFVDFIVTGDMQLIRACRVHLKGESIGLNFVAMEVVVIAITVIAFL